MTKRHIPIVIAAGLVGVAVFGYLGMFLLGSSKASDKEVMTMFACDRKTKDVRATDVYCENPDLYREHVRINRVIEN